MIIYDFIKQMTEELALKTVFYMTKKVNFFQEIIKIIATFVKNYATRFILLKFIYHQII